VRKPDLHVQIVDDLLFELEQYRALRAEVIQSMDDGNTIMAFGLTAVGLLVNAAIMAKDTFFGFLVLAALLPLASALVLSLWFSAHERIARASHFLSGVEARLAAETSRGPSWEAWLRGSGPDYGTRHFWSTEQAGIALFALISFCSMGASFATGGEDTSVVAQIGVVVPSALGTALVLAQVRRRYRNWKRWLATSFAGEE
jgi:hypothetical protein